MLTGEIKNWEIDRGFGFILRDDGERDLFVHFRELVGAKADHLPVGLRVRFEIGTDNLGRQHARNVRPITEYK
jgi:cold shock protein